MQKWGLLLLVTLLLIVPVAAQDAVDLVCGQVSVEGAESGAAYTATCPAGCSASSLWGTDVYTDDSDICTAAAHAGVIDLAEGGTFDLLYIDGQDDHPASEQNGIESSSWGSWDLSFTFGGSDSIALTCDQTSVEGAVAGDSFSVTCPAKCNTGSLWGTDVYTDDSNICTAAAHAGVIDLAEGGTFDLLYVDGQDDHPASEQNGIESSSWGSWDLSFTFGIEAIAMEWGETGQVLEGETGAYGILSCPAGGVEGFIWGTDVYSDDSGVCTAAVHAGLITFKEGGEFIFSILDGQESYEATVRNDVESLEWPAWERSFAVTPLLLEIEWGTSAQELVGSTGTTYVVECPEGGSASSLWGTGIYSDDSSICTAAVHDGVITLEDGGEVIVTIIDGQDSYEASSQNGIDSSDWPAWERSFIVE